VNTPRRRHIHPKHPQQHPKKPPTPPHTHTNPHNRNAHNQRNTTSTSQHHPTPPFFGTSSPSTPPPHNLRDLPCWVRLRCPRTIINKNTRSPHPTRRHGPSPRTNRRTARPRTVSGTCCHPVRCCHLCCGVHTWSLYRGVGSGILGVCCGVALSQSVSVVS